MFVWDEKKRKKVIESHAVDFKQILDVFQDAFSDDFIDHEYSDHRETRYDWTIRSIRIGFSNLLDRGRRCEVDHFSQGREMDGGCI